MFGNYLKIAVRNLSKYKGYSVINILGLAIGLACCILILLYVQDELSYDRFHQQSERLYRITSELQSPVRPDARLASTPPALAEILAQDVPGIEAAVRLKPYNFFVKQDDRQFYEDRFFFTDPAFLETFHFPLAEGSKTDALNQPFSVVLTSATAEKYFGNSNPVGEILLIEDSLQFTVSGVFAPLPTQSHIQFDLLASFETLKHPALAQNYPWWSFNLYTYALLEKSADTGQVASQLLNVADPYVSEQEKEYGMEQKYHLQPFEDIYLHSHLQHEMSKLGDILYVYLFGGIAILILIVACVNFINLATARSIHRAKEVGMRKTLGAQRRQLLWQFLGESLLFSFLAMVVSLVIIELALPYFNDFSGKSLQLNAFQDWTIIPAFAGLTIIVSITAGSYPAFVLARIPSVEAFRNRKSSGRKASRLRSGLVIFQFTISVALISVTLIAGQQLQFMQTAKLGFAQEQVVIIPAKSVEDFSTRYAAIKQQFLAHPAVVSATAASSIPGKRVGEIVYIPEGAEKNETRGIKTLTVDTDFVATYNMEMAAGRNFSREFATDADAGFVLNETAVAEIGWGTAENAIGKNITWGWPGKHGQVIGVVKDFHQTGLQEKIAPMLMHIQPSWFQFISLKLAGNNILQTVKDLEAVWQGVVPGRPFDYFFMDEFYGRQYESEARTGKLFTIFSLLAILIACFGLFSLAAFTTRQRTKEIGIRRVLGASTPGLISLLSKHFLMLVLTANIFAIPISWLAMSRWLENFAYHIEIDWQVFLISGGLALIVAMLTVSYQAIRAALANSVEALRHE